MGIVARIGVVIADEIMREGMSVVLASSDFHVHIAVPDIAGLSADQVRDVDIVIMALLPSDSIAGVCEDLADACPKARHVLTAPDFQIDDMASPLSAVLRV